MSNAPMPEKIIAWRMHPSKVNEDLHGGWADAEDKREVSYTRTDVVDRIVQDAVKEALQVKPLVWEFTNDDLICKAVTPFGVYGCLFDDDSSAGGIWAVFSSDVESIGMITARDVEFTYSGLEKAQASAQADYTRRILSALKGN